MTTAVRNPEHGNIPPTSTDILLWLQAQLPVWLSLCASARYDSLLRRASSARFCSLRSSTNATPSFELLKQRAANQHGHAAAIFPEKLLLVWLKKTGCQCLCHGALVAFAQFGRRQIRPAQSARDEILTVVLQHL